MKKKDKLRFKKFTWVITDKIEHISGFIEYRYRVYRRYFKALIPLSYTNQTYPIAEWRWRFLQQQLQNDPNYHYNMHLWSGCKRIK